jgi:MEDS: MEthanogen/methylotroph, DcmR Sensory domain
MPPPLFTLLEGRFPIARHEHVAVLERERAGTLRFASFLDEGLKSGDACHYLAPTGARAAMLRKLRVLEPNLDRYLRSERLSLHGSIRDFSVLRDRMRRAFARAERAHVPGVRWLEDGSWPEASGLPMHEYFEFHALLNYQVKHYPSAAVCQYSLDSMPPDHLYFVIAVHRHLVVEETAVRDNPFYTPPERFLPLSVEERERDMARVFQEIEFDPARLLDGLAGYGRLHREPWA